MGCTSSKCKLCRVKIDEGKYCSKHKCRLWCKEPTRVCEWRLGLREFEEFSQNVSGHYRCDGENLIFEKEGLSAIITTEAERREGLRDCKSLKN